MDGAPDFEVKAIKTPQEAEEDDIVFLYHHRFLKMVQESSSLAVVLKKEFAAEIKGKNLVVVDNPRYAFSKLVPCFFEIVPSPFGIHSQAFVHPRAALGKGVSVGAFSVIEEGVCVGEGTVIFPQV
ncbi:MAG: LpxD N-terminal domain-containing protein, partial [Candidatus Caldatribacteriaceae bacterium]